MTFIRSIFIALVLALIAAPAFADDYPDKDIHMICSQAAGSGADTLVRYFSNQLSQISHATTIVENKPGAVGTIALRAIASAKPDGYTLYVSAGNSIASAPHMMLNMPVDVQKSYTFVTTLAQFSFILVVDGKSPYNSVSDLVEALKKKPDGGKYGVTATSGLVSAELFKSTTGLKTVRVNYIDSMTSMNDMAGGQIDFMFLDPVAAVEQMRSGKIKGLAVASDKRLNAIPEVPSMAEAGYPAVNVATWWTVVAPKDTPKPIIDKLEGWMNTIVTSDETREFLKRNGMDPFPGTSASAEDLFEKDYVRWEEYIRLAGIEKQ